MTIRTDFSSSIAQAIELLETLNTLLVTERGALEERDSTNLQAVLDQKTRLLQELQENASERSQLLLNNGVSGDEAGMEHYLQSLPASASALQQQWQTLKQLLQACKDANQINGTMVHRSKSQNDALLSILRGQSGQQKLYNDAGQSAMVGHGHSLAKA